jgi:hypothetical protein
MTETLTIFHICPICGLGGLQTLSEQSVRSVHTEICANENYLHVQLGRTHYFVRKAENRLQEVDEPSINIQFFQ